jgi:hypothetical protein
MSAVDFSIDFGSLLGASLSDFGRFRAQAADMLDEVETRWQEELLEVWPVDTGTSLQAWDNFVAGLRWTLRNAVEYVSFVHVEGDTESIAEFLRAKAQDLAQGILPDLRNLLAQANREATVPRAQARMFGRKGARLPSPGAVVSQAVFAATEAAFQIPGRGARQRLRIRFPNEPIGRATTRRRSRERVR